MNEHLSTGWLYILRNPSMPQMVKVGHTTRNPAARAKDLSAETGIPTPFYVVRAFEALWPKKAEEIAHQKLHYLRVRPNREFFDAKVPDGRNFKVDADIDEYFAIEIESAIAEARLLSKWQDLSLQLDALGVENEMRRRAFLDACSRKNYPERWEETEARLAELPDNEK